MVKKFLIYSSGSRISLGGGAPTPKVGVLTYFLAEFEFENERIWTPGGVPGAPLRSATDMLCNGFYLLFEASLTEGPFGMGLSPLAIPDFETGQDLILRCDESLHSEFLQLSCLELVVFLIVKTLSSLNFVLTIGCKCFLICNG